MTLRATLFSDPACPWAYSATPSITTLRWRYGDQIEWQLVTIGLREDTSGQEASGYSPARQATGSRMFRERFGMPFAAAPRARLVPTGRACRAIVATRIAHPGREFDAIRALAFAWFNTPLLLDEDDAIGTALAPVEGIDAPAVVAAIDTPETIEAYERDKASTRSAEGGATEFQGKAAISDGLVRFTAPSVVFENGSGRLEVGGFQPLEAYDVAIANLDTSLERRPAAEDPAELLARFPGGLCTQEVAVMMAGNLVEVDRAGAEDALIRLLGEGRAVREALGDDAIWRPATA
jgi:2-hydroxychromene-2-carboxylate isomerase